MTDHTHGATLIVMDDMAAAVIVLTGTHCSVCRSETTLVPGMFLYRPAKDRYDIACRECTITIMRAASVRLKDPEYSG